MKSAAILGSLAGFLVIGLAQAQIPRFQHVVVIVQENRTPDNLFQGLCATSTTGQNTCSITPSDSQYNIQTGDWLDRTSPTGVTQPSKVPLGNRYDLSHTHKAFLDMCNADPASGACRNNGAAAVPCAGTCLPTPQYRYVDNSSGIVQPYLDLARQYGFANYMFQTNQGPSFPAHQFLFGGTSAPSAAADAAGTFASENTGGSSEQAGCIAPAGTVVALIDAAGNDKQLVYPCFDHQTIPDLLPPSVNWKYYAPNAGSIWTAPNAISHICQSTGPGGKCIGPDWIKNVDLTPSHVLSDIAECQLPSVSWVIPTGVNSDHANVSDGGGPSWVAAIVNAIGKSSSCDANAGYWNNTAVVITWDDWGGWYDHEPPSILPQPQGSYQYGFRVPMLFVSAYTPAGYINNIRHDFGSILRFIEFNFSLPEGGLNFADARASTDLTRFFDLNQKPRTFQTIKAPKSGKFFLKDKRKVTDPDDDR